MNAIMRFARREPPAVAAYVIMAVVVIAWMLNTSRLSISSVAIVISQVLPLAMVACGMAIVIFGKGIDLSLGNVLTITNVIVIVLAGRGVPIVLAAVAALVVAIVVGAINGLLIAYMGLPPLVITLATSSILAGSALYILPQPGGSVPRWFADIPLLLIGPIPFSLVLLIGLPVLVWYPIRRSKLGPAIMAVGEDETSAFTSGINVKATRALTYVLGAVFACLGGILMTMTAMSGDPKIGVPFTMNAIAAAVLGGTVLAGGRGTLAGAVAGAVTLQLIGNLLFSLGLNGYWQYVVIGLILVAALGGPYLIGRARQNSSQAIRRAA
ncbi:ABC transporter permease [Brooklawnia cerclae]|uniref:Autoinducer 2 import system permease protein LsrD n=1 Tax=Brooklawnia cerclae TaxID=349934 RepID=A0ABX0SCB6_9ACTN|nr:ABC transporter permease [Brooklawnia cerclae]NIH56029.1 ribose transport system permease protein [Brooklawnia cerclae]